MVRGFNSDWKKSLESINNEVMKAFTNFKNGTAILQVRRDLHACTVKEILFMFVYTDTCKKNFYLILYSACSMYHNPKKF